MTWRLQAIALYQRDGPGREIHVFRTHGLNIISGDSKTGKSAVIDIINYGLMSESCPIPKGVIRRAVGLVGLHLVKEDDEMLVLREIPAAGKKTATGAWVQNGNGLQFPNDKPQLNWNQDQAKGLISDFTGISGANVLSNPKEFGVDFQFAANIRHAAPLCFQPQDVIANRYVSFPGLDRETHRRHLLDALPFLLGIETSETLAKRSKLRELKIQLRRLQMQGLERQKLRANVFERGYNLFQKCVGRGILSGQAPQDVPGLMESLRGIDLDSTKRFDIASRVPNLQALENQEKEARRLVLEHRRRVRELQQFENATLLHQGTVNKQLERLSVSQLMPQATNGHTCPVCQDGKLHAAGAQEALVQIQEKLASVKAIPLRIDHKSRTSRVRLENELPALEEAHQAAKSRLRDAIQFIAKDAEAMRESREIDMLVGQVQEYVQTVNVAQVPDQESTEELEKQIQAIQAQLEAGRKKIEKVRDTISTQMTELARRMEVEFSSGKAQLDVEDLSIKVQVDAEGDAMTLLSEVGSGANWVSYHVAAALALHQHLSDNNCPVPRLLVFDQPSQAWFPRLPEGDTIKPEAPGEENKPKRQEDVDRVVAIYRMVLDLAKQADYSQVVILDHAYFHEPWFKDNLVDEWRGGKKLVPPHWDSAKATDSE